MTKYISVRGACRVSNWHYNPDCSNLKREATEATESELEYHDLEPCARCVTGYEPSSHKQENWKYQNATVDEDNDPLDRIHD